MKDKNESDGKRTMLVCGPQVFKAWLQKLTKKYHCKWSGK